MPSRSPFDLKNNNIETILRYCVGMKTDPRVHGFNSGRCGAGLGFLNIPRAEEKLSVQIRLFDPIHVRYVDATTVSSSYAHHCKVLEQLAADGPSTHHEIMQIAQLLLELGSKYSHLNKRLRAQQRK